MERLTYWLVVVLATLGLPIVGASESGVGMDPNGKEHCAHASSDSGACMDPNGNEKDEGVGMDPNGKERCARAESDEGVTMDPDG